MSKQQTNTVGRPPKKFDETFKVLDINKNLYLHTRLNKDSEFSDDEIRYFLNSNSHKMFGEIYQEFISKFNGLDLSVFVAQAFTCIKITEIG